MSKLIFDYCLKKELIPENYPENRSNVKLMVVNRSNGKIEHRKFIDCLEYFKCETLFANRSRFSSDPRRQPIYANGLETKYPHGAGIPFEDWMVKRLSIVFVDLLCGYQNTIGSDRIFEDRVTNQEYYELSMAPVDKVICIGGTTVKAIESYGVTGKLLGLSNYYAGPGTEFKFTKGLLTCFHFPDQPLMAMVNALLGNELTQEAYAIAMEGNYKITDKGDRMLII